jgi:hypothetical protein
LLVLIDESGDPGFKLVSGSTSHFVVAMVIFDEHAEAERTSRAIDNLRERLRLRTEFKFSKSHDRVRDEFFTTVCGCSFVSRALVVDKALVYSASLRDRKELFYNFFVRMLLRHDGGVLKGARIKIDGSGDRRFKHELNAYLRRQLEQGQVSSIKFAESHRDNLIQLADMVAGAVLRSYRQADRKESARWRTTLERSGRLVDVWDFR